MRVGNGGIEKRRCGDWELTSFRIEYYVSRRSRIFLGYRAAVQLYHVVRRILVLLGLVDW